MIDLGTVHLITDRPGATPAPTPQPQPTPPMPPASSWQPRTVDPGLTRWAPNANRQHLTAITSDTDDLIAASRATVADVNAGIERHRRSNTDLGEVA